MKLGFVVFSAFTLFTLPAIGFAELPSELEYADECEMLDSESFRGSNANGLIPLGIYKGKYVYDGEALDHELYVYESSGKGHYTVRYAHGENESWDVKDAGCITLAAVERSGTLVTQKMGNGAYAIYTPSEYGLSVEYVTTSGFRTPGNLELIHLLTPRP